MPNWCQNILRVECDSGEELRRFLDSNSGGEVGALSLNRSHPVPPMLSVSEAYDWRCKNWNTEWDVVDGYVDEWEDMHVLHFETAWAPPLGWLEVVVALYPTLNFHLEYREPNTCLFGEVMGEGVKIVSHLHYEAVELVR